MSPAQKSIISLLLAILIALSWSNSLDDAAYGATTDKFKTALAIAALARGFNGVISVAQGTEVAIQPVGVGVTLTLGEILDPLNDLVERFSFLALLASVSLGVQLTLTEIAATPWLSALFTAAGLGLLYLLWRKPPYTQLGLRILGVFFFARFMLAFTLLATHWVSDSYLADKQTAAIAQLSDTATTIETLQTSEPALPGSPQASADPGLIESIGNLFESAPQTLDVQAQLDSLKAKVEQSVEHMVTIIVIFLLQTLSLPLLSLALLYQALKGFWRRSNRRIRP